VTRLAAVAGAPSMCSYFLESGGGASGNA